MIMRMVSRMVGLAGMLVMLSLALPTQLHAAPGDKGAEKADKGGDKNAPLASMGGVNLTVGEFQALMNNSDKEVKKHLLENPELMKQKIGEAMLRKYFLAKAREQKVDQKGDVAFMMERAREGVLVENFLNISAKVPAKYPEESLVRQAYDENKSRFMLPQTVNVAQIFLKYEPNMDDKAKQDLFKLAERYMTMVQKKESEFASLAQKFSQHPASASQGGDMGWVPLNQLLPEFQKAISGLKNGEVAGPIKTPQGVHVVQLRGTKEPTPRPYDEVKPALTKMLKDKKLQENKDAYVSELLGKTQISLNEQSRALLK
ncbi:Chaperone SurA [Candidatus Magnetaquicoccaceae bacterium FCR-1]|uniref:peptidylprolyl isomerase n=2 Tax=Candidatus Magnetaquiglobus chichijimensis TaxID=3141448 RepID=A0ABQ0CBK0_9PROT